MSQHVPSHPQSRLSRLAEDTRTLFLRVKKGLLTWSTLVALSGMLLMLILFTLAIVPTRYDLSVGMVPTHTITASRDVVDDVTTEARRAAAAQAVQPTYHYVEGVSEAVLGDFDQIFTQLDSAVQYSETLSDYGPTRRYTADELSYARSILTMLELQDFQLRTLLNTPRTDLSELYTTLYAALQNTLSSYVTEGMESEAITSIMQIVGFRVDTSLLQNVVLPVLRTVIRPNMVIDQEATEAARQLARDAVSPIVYKQGQNIVVKGEGLVEPYQYAMLSELGLLSETSVDMSIYWGAALLVLLVMSTAVWLLYRVSPQIVRDPKRLMLVFAIAVITLIASILLRLANIYLAPIALCALLLSAMLGLETAVVFNIALTLLVSGLAAGGSSAYTAVMVQLLTCTLCSGALGALILSRHISRLRVIAAGLAVGACNFAVIIALGLMTSGNLSSSWENALWGAGGGLISGLLCIALQPLLEVLFNLPTPTKLMELSNPNHPLLRRLLLEAPGTYHHSILVANLAEAAAEAIGANPLLARVGGYYHDIGKLRRPQYFRENQLGGENVLTENDPYTAAQIVISHTHDGVTLAHNYHLPREVVQIIRQHHGNTPVMYFYSIAVKQANGQPVDDQLFRYDAEPPATKEGAVVLLCDTIEAAVRSMQNPTPDAIEEFIIKLVRGKLQDGQLSNSPLTLKDIDDICHASATVLNGVFHERIEYPDPPAALQKKHSVPDAPAAAEEPPSSKQETVPAAGTPLPPKAAPSAAKVLDPSQFESADPLPLVAPPRAEAPLSIAEALEQAEESENIEKDEPQT